jgi:hypothetical protein
MPCKLTAMEALVDGVQDNDRLLFFFSGNSSQMYGPFGESSGDGFIEGKFQLNFFDHRMII